MLMVQACKHTEFFAFFSSPASQSGDPQSRLKDLVLVQIDFFIFLLHTVLPAALCVH